MQPVDITKHPTAKLPFAVLDVAVQLCLLCSMTQYLADRATGTIPQKNMVDYYRQRAQGAEGGFIIAEASLVSQEGHG